MFLLTLCSFSLEVSSSVAQNAENTATAQVQNIEMTALIQDGHLYQHSVGAVGIEFVEEGQHRGFQPDAGLDAVV